MNFNFHLAACASSNTATAKGRESLRMACLALAMEQLGHGVAIVDAPPELSGSPRGIPFRHLDRSALPGAVEVHPAEILKSGHRRADVAFKCSVGTHNDPLFLDRSQVLVAHEYLADYDRNPRLLPVPFMVHDSVMDLFLADGLFWAFIQNDFAAIRAKYSRPKTGALLGMRACVHHHRRRFCDEAPDWAREHLELYSYQASGPVEHLPWLSRFRGGLELPGTTPKTNLMSLLALLGVAIVKPPPPERCRDTPVVSRGNAILIDEADGGWERVREELNDIERVDEVIEQASSDYANGWSPAGQARLIAERFS